MRKIILRITTFLIISMILFCNAVYAEDIEILHKLAHITIKNKGILLASYDVNEPDEAYNCKKLSEDLFEAEIDDELINGAILELEYLFIVKTKEIFSSMEIHEYAPESTDFDFNSYSLEFKKTNKDLNWNKDLQGKIFKESIITQRTIPKGDYLEFSTGIIFTRVLGIGADLSQVTNKVDIDLKSTRI